MNQRNYQKELENILETLPAACGSGKTAEASEAAQPSGLPGEAPTLFLHACCAPCSSYVLEYLSGYFKITVFYYNPNISPEAEYVKRVEELHHFVDAFSKKQKGYPIQIVSGAYEPQRFYDMAKGMEHVPEGGERCFACYEMRLAETARLAAEGGYDYFCTTLSISPLKNAEKLMEIGERLSAEYGVRYLPGNFKKKNGYKRSIELSHEYGLYRQDYCGCIFSKAARKKDESTN